MDSESWSLRWELSLPATNHLGSQVFAIFQYQYVSVVQMGMFSNSKQLYLYSGLINSVERLHEPRTSASLASRSYSFEFKGPTRYYITSFPYLCFSSFYLCVCDIILSIGTKCKSWSSRAQPLIRLLFIFFLFYYLYKIKALPRDRWDSQFSTDANHV